MYLPFKNRVFYYYYYYFLFDEIRTIYEELCQYATVGRVSRNSLCTIKIYLFLQLSCSAKSLLVTFFTSLKITTSMTSKLQSVMHRNRCFIFKEKNHSQMFTASWKTSVKEEKEKKRVVKHQLLVYASPNLPFVIAGAWTEAMIWAGICHAEFVYLNSRIGSSDWIKASQLDAFCP